MMQQEWLRDWFHNHLLAGEYEDGQPDVFSRAFVAAYPSSPQGLAAKALVEALEDVLRCYDITGARKIAKAALAKDVTP